MTKGEATIGVISAVADAIRDLREVSAGHLYAHLAGHMTLETFERVISILTGMGVVTRDAHHMLRWKGVQR